MTTLVSALRRARILAGGNSWTVDLCKALFMGAYEDYELYEPIRELAFECDRGLGMKDTLDRAIKEAEEHEHE